MLGGASPSPPSDTPAGEIFLGVGVLWVSEYIGQLKTEEEEYDSSSYP